MPWNDRSHTWYLLGPALALVVLCALATGLARPRSRATASVRSTPWAAVLCAFPDQPSVPATTAAIANWVTASGKGQGGLWDYFHDVSYGQLDLTGSTVVTDPATPSGWVAMPQPLTYYNQFSGPSPRRTIIFHDCLQAAVSRGADLGSYYGVLALLNTQKASESGAATMGQGPVTVTKPDGSTLTLTIAQTVLDPGAWDDTFAAQELLHGYNLRHSWADNPDVEYGNPYDVMSGMTNVYPTTGPQLGVGSFVGWAGAGLNAPNLDTLGLLDPSRVVAAPAGLTAPSVELAALNRPGANGYLMAKVTDPSDSTHYYTVEFRQKRGWDAGIPQDSVIIHEVRANGLNYLVRYGGGPALVGGQAFDNASYTVQIHVECLNSTAGTATVTLVVGRYSGCGQGQTPTGTTGSGGASGGGGAGGLPRHCNPCPQ
jgi:hypothetical protein